MNPDVFGPLISITLYLTGAWLGWRISKLRDGEVSPQSQGFWRPASKQARIFVRAGGVMAIGATLSFLAWHLDSRLVAFIGFFIGVASCGVAHGAGLRGWLEFVCNRSF